MCAQTVGIGRVIETAVNLPEREEAKELTTRRATPTIACSAKNEIVIVRNGTRQFLVFIREAQPRLTRSGRKCLVW
jgi:hypothetical protein